MPSQIRMGPLARAAGLVLLLMSSVWPASSRARAEAAPGPLAGAAGYPQSADDWAWEQVQAGREADFGTRACPSPPNGGSWGCRDVTAGFLAAIVRRGQGHELVPAAGVRIRGARVVGTLDLSGTLLDRPMEITGSTFDGPVRLSGLKADSAISFEGSVFEGGFQADGMRADRVLDLELARFERPASLAHSRLGMTARFAGASFLGGLYAADLRVDGGLQLGSISAPWLNLVDSRIAGALQLDGAQVAGLLDAGRSDVGSTLFAKMARLGGCAQRLASFGQLNLKRAKVALNVEMNGLEVSGIFNGEGLQVGGDLYMQSRDAEVEEGCSYPAVKASFKGVDLHLASIGGYLDADRARIGGVWDAGWLRVGAWLSMRDAEFAAPVFLNDARIAGNLDVRKARMSGLRLSGAAVGGALQLGDASETGEPVVWLSRGSLMPDLDLVNARARPLMDSRASWPARGHLHLDGFAFEHLGGEGLSGKEMRGRGADWWDENWAQLDSSFVPAAYAQLAAAFASAGETDLADEIRYDARVRQMDREGWCSWLLSSVLRVGAGFGIGNGAFRVLVPVALISLGGALLLWAKVPCAREKGKVWCFGASLSRLLPVIEINKEFGDFFDDPGRTRLTAGLSLAFSIVALVGWVLGFILVAAMSGLLPKS